MEVTLADGTQLSDRVEAVRGTPRNPMSRAEIVDKARDLIGPVLGAAAPTALIDALLALDTLADVRTLRPLLQRPEGRATYMGAAFSSPSVDLDPLPELLVLVADRTQSARRPAVMR